MAPRGVMLRGEAGVRTKLQTQDSWLPACDRGWRLDLCVVPGDLRWNVEYIFVSVLMPYSI